MQPSQTVFLGVGVGVGVDEGGGGGADGGCVELGNYRVFHHLYILQCSAIKFIATKLSRETYF